MSEINTNDLALKIRALNDWRRLTFCAAEAGHAWVNLFVEAIGAAGKLVAIVIAIALWLAPGIAWVLTS